MQSENILDNLNTIAEKFFKTVESDVYSSIDKILTVDAGLLKMEPLKNIFFENKTNGLILIANALILFYIIQYVFSIIVSLYNGNKIENVYVFILKLIIVGIVVNYSYFIIEQILELFGGLSYAITKFCEQIAGEKVCFVSLKEAVLDIKTIAKSDVISLDGLIKGVISFGMVSILINFSVRYVTIIFLVILTPLAIVSLSSDSTSGIFKSWLNLLVSSLGTQIIVKLVILIPLMYKNTNDMLYKIILVGTIYILYKINNLSKDIFSKIASEMPKRNIFKGE